MKKRITEHDLREAAHCAGLDIQHDCGGYRLVKDIKGGGCRYVYPSGGICPTRPKRELMIFIEGYRAAMVDQRRAVAYSATKPKRI